MFGLTSCNRHSHSRKLAHTRTHTHTHTRTLTHAYDHMCFNNVCSAATAAATGVRKNIFIFWVVRVRSERPQRGQRRMGGPDLNLSSASPGFYLIFLPRLKQTLLRPALWVVVVVTPLFSSSWHAVLRFYRNCVKCNETCLEIIWLYVCVSSLSIMWMEYYLVVRITSFAS